MQFNYSLQNIDEATRAAWAFGSQYKVWAFYGEMGSGKTTLIHQLCEMLQVSSAIGSPTYSIINEYASPLAGTIHHMDWYRLNSIDEALQAGVEDTLYSGYLCFVEWPAKAPELLPGDTLNIHISIVSEDTRSILLQPPGCYTSSQNPDPLNLPKSS